MEFGSCVAKPAASSMWTVLQRQSCEDRSALCVSLEQQSHHKTQTDVNINMSPSSAIFAVVNESAW